MRYIALLLTLLAISCGKEKSKTIKSELLAALSETDSKVLQLRTAVDRNSTADSITAAFFKSRLAYKKVEWAVEYFQPESARFINGPALDEMELDENKFFPPNGFQVIEELVAPQDTVARAETLREIDILRSNLEQVKRHIKAINLSDAQVLDALRQQVYRVITLGVTGFDSPILLTSIPEARVSLQSISNVLRLMRVKPTDSVFKKISEAAQFCQGSFESFDRAQFILDYANPVSKALSEFRISAKLESVPRTRVVRDEAETLFALHAFDADAFIPSPEYQSSPEKIALGEKLFYDSNLSRGKTRSCATCHNPDKSFADGLKTATALAGHNLARNTPTLLYAAYQHAQFWDMRQLDLERQSVDVIGNKDEMHGDFAQIVRYVTDDRSYQATFAKAFPNAKSVEKWHVQNAIAAYVRTLGKFNSRFDIFMRGESKQLTKNEVSGMNLFMGKAKCATCHFTPLFNGTVPPSYVKTEHEVIGTPSDHTTKELSADSGRWAFNQMDQLRGAFKTPTVRNIAQTAPYMHNGAFRTLEEVVEFYDKGGGVGNGLKVDNQTLPPDALNLTAKEKQELIAFMKTLSDAP